MVQVPSKCTGSGEEGATGPRAVAVCGSFVGTPREMSEVGRGREEDRLFCVLPSGCHF